MQNGAHRKSAQSGAAVTAALEAAATRVSQRAMHVLVTARLATAIHMRQAAESSVACQEPAETVWYSIDEAATDQSAAASSLPGEGRR